jgi:hypothetical protein
MPHDRSHHHCDTIVITAPKASIFQTGNAHRPLVETAITIAFGQSDAGRYDLLTAFSDEPDAQETGLIVENIRSAMTRHGVSRALVALPRKSQALAERLSASGLADLEISALDLIGLGNIDIPYTERLAVMCMDWRQHGTQGGILPALEQQYGFGSYGFCTMAGGAKWAIDPAHPRGAFLIDRLARLIHDSVPLTRIHLFIHRDCGAYGGDEGFTSASAQAERLRQDALLAAANVRAAVTTARWGAKVTAGIIELRNDSIADIRSL